MQKISKKISGNFTNQRNLCHAYQSNLPACLPACLLTLAFAGEAFAVDHYVSTEAQYLAALADPAATRIILTGNVSLDTVNIAPPIRVQSVVSLEGQADEYGVLPILDGRHGTRVLNTYFLGAVFDVDSIRNIVIQHAETQTSLAQINGGAMYIHEKLLNGIHNASFFYNFAIDTGGALSIAHRNQDIDGLLGGVHNSTFSGNVVTGLNSRGGALYVNGTLLGGINYSVFTDNHAGGDGGAIRVRNFDGDLQGSVFADNTAQNNGGAIWVDDVSKNWVGNVYDSVFTNNHAVTGYAGAIDTTTLNGVIDNTRFIGNSAALAGGAVLVGTVDGIRNSLFVGNRVQGRAFDYAAGQGAAVSLDENVTLANNVFLNNAASSLNADAADSGFGGALFHHEAAAPSVDVNVVASAGNQALFYGNTQNPHASGATPNAIHFANALSVGNDRRTRVNVQADGRVLMLDPLSAQQDGLSVVSQGTFYGNLETEVNKTGAGAWFLGGTSQMRGASTWNVNAGMLALTTVDYGAGAPTDAKVNLSHAGVSVFNLNANATLAGSGEISAQTITLNGTISPEMWVNTGVKAPDVEAETNAIIATVTASVMADASVASIDKLKTINQRVLAQTQALVDVVKVSDVGRLNLNGNATLDANSTTVLDAHPDAGQSDRITVTGGVLTIAAAATAHVRNGADAWALNTPYTLIEAAGGVMGAFANPVFTGFDAFVFVAPTLTQTGTQVQLQLQRNGTPFASICQTDNQCALAGAADTLPAADPVENALAILTEDEALRAYDNLSGEIYASTRAALIGDRQLRDALNRRMQGHDDAGKRLWVNAWGQSSRLDGNASAVQANTSGWGLALGLDHAFTSNLRAGAFLAYEDKRVTNGSSRHSRSDVDGRTSNRFAGRGSRFEIAGTGVDKNQALIGLGLQAQLSPNASVHVGYQGQFGSNTRSHTGQLQVRVRF